MLRTTLGEMIEGQTLLALPPEASVHQAAVRMRERHVGSVLVTGATGQLLGIFTERDAICRVLADALDPAQTPLSQVMTRSPATLPPDALALDALRLMRDGRFRHVPVAHGDRVLGMVSFTDFRGVDLTRLQQRLEDENGMFEALR